jgi:hypothetical protein
LEEFEEFKKMSQEPESGGQEVLVGHWLEQ